MARNNDTLFWGNNLRDVFESKRQQICDAIHRLTPNQLTAENQAQVEGHFIEDNTFHPLTLRKEELYLEEPKEVEIQRQGSFGPVMVKHLQFNFCIPFEGNSQLFNLQPDRYTYSPPHGEVRNRLLIHTQIRTDRDEVQVKAELERFIGSVEEYIGWQTEMIENWNQNLDQFVRLNVAKRREKLIADKELIENLGFRIVPNGQTPHSTKVPLKRKRVMPLPQSRPGKVSESNPAMDLEIYEEILGTLEGMSIVMERSPSSFSGIDEEALRTHFMVPLNTNFRGMASGETFNAAGKTDILIKYEDRILFIAECKFWRGEKSLSEAIDQLLSYSTWREAKTAILIFNRNQDFSKVIAKVPPVFRSHPNFIREESYKKESGFRFIMKSQSDSNRHLIVTALLFDLPVKEKQT